MEVEIKATIFITPSPPPSQPPIILPLSRLDNDRNFHLPFRTLRLYSPPSSTSSIDIDPFTVIIQSLSRALSLYYPLAGTLHLLSVRCSPDDNVPLTIGTFPRSLASFQTEQPPGSDLLNSLAPNLDTTETQPRLLKLQLTRFACGSLALGMCVYHAMCDGSGTTKFLSAVAGFARGEEPVGVVYNPVWDRLGLLGPRSPARVEVDFGEVLEFDEDGPYYDNREVMVLRECFHVSNVCLNRFRNRLAGEAGFSFTAFEALGAFIWQTRIIAIGIGSEEVVKFVYSMNISKLLKPALPDGYWGNVCVPVYVKLTVKQLLEQPISETAGLIKKSKQDVTDEYVRSYLDFQELHYGKGITAGRLVSGFTDWRHLGHSEVDFGWGSPRVVLPLSWRILGSVEPTFFLPYAAEDERKKDGFKVLVCLPEKVMAVFRIEMDKFNSQN